MATYAQLQADVMAWLDRRDVGPQIPGWVSMAEADIIAQLRARVMVVAAIQQIDAPLISLPADFGSMESLRDVATGQLLDLEDDWTGPLAGDGGLCTAYRLTGNCIEFLPHPDIPLAPPIIGWEPQAVRMTWYRGPRPLVDPGDTNVVLERHYAIYLFAVCKYGAMFELDDDRAAQMKDAYEGAVATANLWKQVSDYSGAPLRAVSATVF